MLTNRKDRSGLVWSGPREPGRLNVVVKGLKRTNQIVSFERTRQSYD
jgi:hypothetical protein